MIFLTGNICPRPGRRGPNKTEQTPEASRLALDPAALGTTGATDAGLWRGRAAPALLAAGQRGSAPDPGVALDRRRTPCGAAASPLFPPGPLSAPFAGRAAALDRPKPANLFPILSTLCRGNKMGPVQFSMHLIFESAT